MIGKIPLADREHAFQEKIYFSFIGTNAELGGLDQLIDSTPVLNSCIFHSMQKSITFRRGH